ncbi:MAG: chromate transporter [Armatimonadota bacterium]|nr:chromate transporter [Armatimonadota bacterium]
MASLFWTFLKIGFVFFGGGFVLIPVIQGVVVNHLHWLTVAEFTDGVAISQLTPGPIAVLATFIGYKQAGVSGAFVATAAVFTPATLLMLFISRGYRHWRDARALRAAMGGIMPAIIGLIVAAGVQLARSSVHGPRDALIGLGALALLVRFNVNPAWLILGAAGLGYLLRF